MTCAALVRAFVRLNPDCTVADALGGSEELLVFNELTVRKAFSDGAKFGWFTRGKSQPGAYRYNVNPDRVCRADVVRS